ncbi:hypothetical protein Syun_025441 [Stephania yunnanensis]|uniref:Uncharacterized protein n=1 Tax=Stephania yunnanensis TaxID=152371 RepID=A0AAP0ES77_9MAGN
MVTSPPFLFYFAGRISLVAPHHARCGDREVIVGDDSEAAATVTSTGRFGFLHHYDLKSVCLLKWPRNIVWKKIHHKERNREKGSLKGKGKKTSKERKKTAVDDDTSTKKGTSGFEYILTDEESASAKKKLFRRLRSLSATSVEITLVVVTLVKIHPSVDIASIEIRPLVKIHPLVAGSRGFFKSTVVAKRLGFPDKDEWTRVRERMVEELTANRD